VSCSLYNVLLQLQLEINTLSPAERRWSSRNLAQQVFSGVDVDLKRFSAYEQSYKPASDVTSEDRVDDSMEIDDDSSIMREVISRPDARNSLHTQVVAHFQALLAELVGRIGGEEILRSQANRNGLSMSIYAPQWEKNEKHWSNWTAAELLEYLGSKEALPPTRPPLAVFLTLPYSPGARRGQDWSTQDWLVSNLSSDYFS
jgi:hypothetical protein